MCAVLSRYLSVKPYSEKQAATSYNAQLKHYSGHLILFPYQHLPRCREFACGERIKTELVVWDLNEQDQNGGRRKTYDSRRPPFLKEPRVTCHRQLRGKSSVPSRFYRRQLIDLFLPQLHGFIFHNRHLSRIKVSGNLTQNLVILTFKGLAHIRVELIINFHKFLPRGLVRLYT